MQPVLLLCVVIAVIGTFASSEHINTRIAFARSGLGSIRGGANEEKLGTSKRRNTSPKKRAEIEEDAEDEDDDDDEHDLDRGRLRNSKSLGKSKISSKSKKSGKRRGKRSNNAAQLVPWGSSRPSVGGKKRKSSIAFSSIKNRLEGIAKTGQAAYKDLYRKAKVLKSSAFEGILLKATWPGNDPVPAELLSEIVKYSIPSFKYARLDSEDDPYYMTLHKLWTKMCEKDWRTIVKSLYILHCISRDSSVEACTNFATAMKDMSATRNLKKPDHKYFELRRLTADLDDNSVPFDNFISSYGSFVFQRTKFFSGKFEELKGISATTPEKKAIAIMKKAQSLIKSGLQCELEKKLHNVIDGQAIRLVAMDLKDLWQLYSDKIALWVSKDTQFNSENKKVSEDVKQILSFFKEYDSKIKAYMSMQSKSFSKLRVKIPNGIDDSATQTTLDSVNTRLEELSKLSGGALKGSSIENIRERSVDGDEDNDDIYEDDNDNLYDDDDDDDDEGDDAEIEDENDEGEEDFEEGEDDEGDEVDIDEDGEGEEEDGLLYEDDEEYSG